MMRARFPRRQRGFTLVEAIVVIVITSILAGVAVLFIRRPMQNYIDSAARADMADVAEIALRRMARELHGALPNSIRMMQVNGITYLEFIPTKAGGIYLSAEDGAPTGTSDDYRPLSFTDAAANVFTVVGTIPAAPYNIAAGDFIVVYNLGTGFQDADAYTTVATDTNAMNRAQVRSISTRNVTLESNPFAWPVLKGRLGNSSPGKRFSVVTQPVTFACQNDAAKGTGTLLRFTGYGFNAAQAVPGGTGARMAGNVYGCQFSVTQAANQNTALVGLSIALARSAPGTGGNNLETVTLTQQIHVDNTP